MFVGNHIRGGGLAKFEAIKLRESGARNHIEIPVAAGNVKIRLKEQVSGGFYVAAEMQKTKIPADALDIEPGRPRTVSGLAEDNM
jgi:hypothetical protein